MEQEEIKELWAAYDQKLQKNWKLNLYLLKEMNLGKASSILRRMIFGKVLNVAIYIGMLIWMGTFIGNHISQLTMVVPAVLVFVLTQVALIWTMYLIVHIGQLDYAEPVIAIQKKLEHIRHSKTLFNQFIFLTCYLYVMGATLTFIHLDIVALWQHIPWVVAINLGFAVAWIPLSLWILSKYQDPNLDSHIWKSLRDDSHLTEATVSKPLNKAMGFVEEIRAFEEE